MAIKLKLTGFESVLKDIEKAGGNINTATRQAMNESAKIMQAELISAMQAADVSSDLVARMPEYKIETSANRVTAIVGYEKGAFNPENLSDGYKVVFLNYGTPRRTKHGQVKARGFIQRAKKKANPKIKKIQENTFDEILKGLQQ